MVDTNIRVQILKNDRCIFNESSKNSNDTNNIAGLITNLKVMQERVNNFITTLIETTERNVSDEDGPNDSENDITDDDSEEDEQVNPKKCKLSN
ncbi:hypothetical protein PV327_000929 [Microctonus hyperodae]|uniref:EKC/KEOPS complex subunit GON7 n=1 Tax=Microctonus hyperodae TaxID=165561 RepID=A0AA39G764_MICHY|nr:hypothetical protein PV327_000929 [Microctonus hyperodae]